MRAGDAAVDRLLAADHAVHLDVALVEAGARNDVDDAEEGRRTKERGDWAAHDLDALDFVEIDVEVATQIGLGGEDVVHRVAVVEDEDARVEVARR